MFRLACLLVLAACLAFASSCTHPTKDWHRKSAEEGTRIVVQYYANRIERNVRFIGDTGIGVAYPPRGPFIPCHRLRKINAGDSGDAIYEAADREDYPCYDRSLGNDLAIVSTQIRGRTFEVAFLYEKDNSGRIADISYLPVRTSLNANGVPP